MAGKSIEVPKTILKISNQIENQNIAGKALLDLNKFAMGMQAAQKMGGFNSLSLENPTMAFANSIAQLTANNKIQSDIFSVVKPQDSFVNPAAHPINILDSIANSVSQTVNSQSIFANPVSPPINPLGSIATSVSQTLNQVGNLVSPVSPPINPLGSIANSVSHTVNQIGSILNPVLPPLNPYSDLIKVVSQTVNPISGFSNSVSPTFNPIGGLVNTVSHTVNPLGNVPNFVSPTINPITGLVNTVSQTVSQIGGSTQHSNILEVSTPLLYAEQLKKAFEKTTILNFPWKSILPDEYFVIHNSTTKGMSDLYKNLETVINNSKSLVNFSPDLTINDGLIASINLDIKNNSIGVDEGFVPDQIIERANEVFETISNDVTNGVSAINNFLIEFFKIDSASFTRNFIRDIVVNLFCAYLVQTMFPPAATISDSVINNSQTTTNIVNNDNRTIINNNTTVNLTVNNLIVGNQYKTFEVKGLKHKRIKKIKSFDEIPEGTAVTVLKKYRKYIIVSYEENRIFKYGYTEANGFKEIE